MNEEKKNLLFKWLRELKSRKSAHYLSAEFCRKRNNFFGISLIISSTIVGSSLFTSLSMSGTVNFYMQLFLGIVSMISAAAASLQSFLKYSERAEAHQAANRVFGRLARRVERFIAIPPGETELEETIRTLQTEIDNANENSPLAIQSIWNRIRHRSQHDRN